MSDDIVIQPVYGPTNPLPEDQKSTEIRRFGSVVGLEPEKEQYYRELHSDTWPDVLTRLEQSHIRNYSIYLTQLEGKKYLFSYFEYTGDDYEADVQAISEDPETQRWWKETDPCQILLPDRKPGAQWSDMEIVFMMESERSKASVR